MSIHRAAAEGFSADAGAYERGRPGYADDLVAWLVDGLGIATGRRVLDVAAGTGKLTRLLTGYGADIVAVEPVAEMRAALLAADSRIETLDAVAEDLPFDDGSVDVVTVAQAFHWFDPEAALTEFARVLRPGGGVALVWNERDIQEPWVAELSRLIRWDQREQWGVPCTLEVDWGARLTELGGPFTAPERYDTVYVQPMDADTLVDRVLSTSYLAALPAPDRAEMADQVRSLVAPMGERFELPYLTVGWMIHRH